MSGIFKKIKKYRRLRAGESRDLQTAILKDVYKKGTPAQRKMYEQEMDTYIQAVESGKIKSGDPLKI